MLNHIEEIMSDFVASVLKYFPSGFFSQICAHPEVLKEKTMDTTQQLGVEFNILAIVSIGFPQLRSISETGHTAIE